MTVVSGGDRTDETDELPSLNEVRAQFVMAQTRYLVGHLLASEQAYYGDLFDRIIERHTESLRARVEAAEAERDAALAVIEKARDSLDSMPVLEGGGGSESRPAWFRANVSELTQRIDILRAAPLRARAAEEGEKQ